MLDSWDRSFMQLAHFWAQQRSKDPITKVGAVLVGLDRRQVALGYNGFPRGVKDTLERYNDRDFKRRLIQHAERNVIDNALFNPSRGTMFCTMFPCSECAKSIANKRIARLVSPAPVTYEPWREDAEIARIILTEGGVFIQEVKL